MLKKLVNIKVIIIYKVESLASWAFGFFGIEGIENDGFHQLPVDGFTTWAGCGFPIAILLFSLRFMVSKSCFNQYLYSAISC